MYLEFACELVMWSPGQTGWFPPGDLVSLSHHTKHKQRCQWEWLACT